MKNWKRFTIIAVIALLLSSCYTVPKVTNPREIREGVFIVRISNEHRGDIYTKYALNTFVKSKGFESYNAEKVETSLLQQGAAFVARGYIKGYTEYTVTMPGRTPVEDMPKVKNQMEINISLK